jgi:glycerol-3-phosphate acyltransferase PlsY
VNSIVILLLLILAASYLLGSIPAGYLAGRLAGVDVRQHGSGNIGATNVLRVVGKPYGFAVFVFDAGKGLAAVRLAYFVFSGAAHPEYYAIAAAVVVVLGHSFPIWLKFKGGKGVATTVGAVAGLIPLAVIPAGIIWLVVFGISRYVSLASIVATALLPVVIAIMLHLHVTSGSGLLYFSIAIALLITWRHRANLARLRAGTEPRFNGE